MASVYGGSPDQRGEIKHRLYHLWPHLSETKVINGAGVNVYLQRSQWKFGKICIYLSLKVSNCI